MSSAIDSQQLGSFQKIQVPYQQSLYQGGELSYSHFISQQHSTNRKLIQMGSVNQSPTANTKVLNSPGSLSNQIESPMSFKPPQDIVVMPIMTNGLTLH